MFIRSATTTLALVVLSFAAVTVHAQAYPSKPICCIVPFPPGGGTVVGAELAARAAPDSYTIFMGTNTSHTINPNLYPKLPYDAIRGFQPLTQIATVSYMLTHPSLPVRTVKGLVALAKARSGH
ncbi:MAG: hypothetical protein HY525_12625 [Betaproteobacteria bacterium]|nr:hypothetical protein [Betaproteobacteria bacterium]